MGIAFRHSKHGGSTLLVLACIAEALNIKTGTWWLYTEEIAARCKLRERQVYRAIAALKAGRELIVMRHGGPKGQNRYALGPALLERAQAEAAPVTGDRSMLAEDLSFTTGQPHGSDERNLSPKTGEPDSSDRCDLSSETGAPVTGDTLNRISLHDQISHREGDLSKSKARQIAAGLRSSGVKNARASQQLQEVASLGGTLEDVRAAIDAAPPSAGDPFAYGVAVLLNRLRVAPAAASEPGDWEDAPWTVVEARGVELGVGKWDQLMEQWPQYKARVTAAAKKAERV